MKHKFLPLFALVVAAVAGFGVLAQEATFDFRDPASVVFVTGQGYELTDSELIISDVNPIAPVVVQADGQQLNTFFNTESFANVWARAVEDGLEASTTARLVVEANIDDVYETYYFPVTLSGATFADGTLTFTVDELGDVLSVFGVDDKAADDYYAGDLDSASFALYIDFTGAFEESYAAAEVALGDDARQTGKRNCPRTGCRR